jgi:hypothetical protein
MSFGAILQMLCKVGTFRKHMNLHISEHANDGEQQTEESGHKNLEKNTFRCL